MNAESNTPSPRSDDLPPLHVVHWPAFLANPYMGLLQEACTRESILSDNAGRGLPSLAKALLKRPSILHIGWAHQAYAAPYPWMAPWSARTFFALVARAKRAGTRVIWTCHNLQGHDKSHPTLDRSVRLRMAQEADRIVVHSAAAALEAQRLFALAPDKIVVMPHGNYDGAYPPGDRGTTREELTVPGSTPLVLFFGAIRDYKNVPALIRAFQERRAPTDARLHIAGRVFDPTETMTLRRLAGDDTQVSLELGFLEDQRLANLLAACDLAVFPFRRSLTSGSIMLALTFGRAVVAPRLASIEELLGGDSQNELYEPDNPQALSKALAASLTTLDRRVAAGLKNREIAASTPWHRSARIVRDTYDAVLRGP